MIAEELNNIPHPSDRDKYLTRVFGESARWYKDTEVHWWRGIKASINMNKRYTLFDKGGLLPRGTFLFANLEELALHRERSKCVGDVALYVSWAFQDFKERYGVPGKVGSWQDFCLYYQRVLLPGLSPSTLTPATFRKRDELNAVIEGNKKGGFQYEQIRNHAGGV